MWTSSLKKHPTFGAKRAGLVLRCWGVTDPNRALNFAYYNLDYGTEMRYYFTVNRKHRQTLSALFARPDKKDIRWDDFIGLLMELGADVSEKGGSMVGLRLNGRYAVFHRPHPGNFI